MALSLPSFYATWRGRRRLMSDLERLSDRLLADAGLDRGGIAGHVRAALPWPEIPTRGGSALAARLQGCG